jgi:hypothetical protein
VDIISCLKGAMLTECYSVGMRVKTGADTIKKEIEATN